MLLRTICVLGAFGLGACGGDSNSGSTRHDAGSSGGSGGTSPADSGVPCPTGDCSLDCNPSDTALALDFASANQPNLKNLGDADAVGPDDVGDGLYHLFAGVAHIDLTDANTWGAVLIHDATAKNPTDEFALPAEPIVSQRDSYDHYGIEVPSYLRFDEHTEYIYYCGIYAKYPDAKGRISALERIDGGAWKKLGPVVPFASGSTSQCEPDALLDPETGLIYLFFIADGDSAGMRVRTSKNPTSFSADTEIGLGKYYTRIASSRDSIANVWRYALDIGGYPHPVWTAQSWQAALPPDDATLQANGEVLHQGDHDLHPTFHANGPYVSQSTGAFYPNASDVIFFYTGELAADPINMRVFSQRCTRR